MAGTRKKKKVVEHAKEAEDRISFLPDEILASILTLLPIIEAVRTSVLSKRWRFVWTTVPHIVLDETCGNEDGIPGKFVIDKWISNVNHILLARRAPLQSCHFKKLEIVKCNVLLPRFSNLRTLYLDGVLLTEESLERLISGCPSLEDFRLRELLKTIGLRIRAPKLKSMDIDMCGIGIIGLMDTPCLRDVKLSYLYKPFDFERFKGNLTTYRFYLDSPPRSVTDQFDLNSHLFEKEDDKEKNEVAELIEYLQYSSIWERNVESISLRDCEDDLLKMAMLENSYAPFQLVHPKKLYMKLRFNNAFVINNLMFLLRSSPNLQELDLQGLCKKRKEDRIEFDRWGADGTPDCLVNHLTMVQIREVHLSSKNVIGFVRFILLNARVLKTMKLHYYTDDRLGEKVVDELLQLKTASPQVVLKVRHIKPDPLGDSD